MFREHANEKVKMFSWYAAATLGIKGACIQRSSAVKELTDLKQ